MSKTPRAGATWWRLLLLLPVVAVLWLPFYNKVLPTVGGWPFFYWYQLLWVLLTAAVTGIVFVIEDARHGDDAP